MTSAEAAVAGLVVALCVALFATQGTLDPRISAFLTTLAVLAALAVVLRRVLG